MENKLIFLLVCLYFHKDIMCNKDSIQLNLNAAKGLVCYQCYSTSSEIAPLCDVNFFKLTQPEEKRDMLLQCPISIGAFCFKKVNFFGSLIETQRGCTGFYDSNGNLMKFGCMDVSKGKNRTILCLCDTQLCNFTTRQLNCPLLTISMSILVIVIYF